MPINDWEALARVGLFGVPTYIVLIFLLRITGNRTLSKMNSFDLVVTIAFGSVLSATLVTEGLPFTTGIAALALLIGLQYVVTWMSVKSPTIDKLVKTTPTFLLKDGRFQPLALKRVRVTEGEIRSVVRQQGYGSLEQVFAVIMETDGSLSVISNEKRGQLSALQDVRQIDD